MDCVLMENKVLNLDKSSWVLTKLGDLAKDISKRVDNPGESEYERFVGLGNFISGDIKIKTWETTENLASSAKAFQSGDILFARRNAYLRRASLVDFDGCCSGDAFVLRENHDKVVPGFLAFLMNSNGLWDYANSNAAGTMSKRVKWRDLAEYEFLLPPKDQQAQLAKLLWAMDAAIEREINALDKEIDFKISYRKALLKGKDSGKFNQLGFLGSYYPIKKLKDYAVVKGRIGWRGLKQSEYVDNGPYLIASKHIKDGHVNWDKCDMITDFRYDESPEIALKQGDVVFSKDGAIGNPAHIDKLPGNATINSTMMLLRPNENLDSEYLYQLLLSAYFERLKIRCLSGSAIPHIFQGDMKNFEFPMPDLLKQKQIGSELKQLDILRRSIEDKIQASQSLQKSIINQIF